MSDSSSFALIISQTSLSASINCSTSTFTWFPGVPIFRSTNLTDWEQLGNALDRPGQLDLSATDVWSSFGIYAPTLRHHDGRFWLITTNMGTEGSKNFFLIGDQVDDADWLTELVRKTENELPRPTPRKRKKN